MLTYEYQLIYGASWVAQQGSVMADTQAEARTKIFEALGIDDPCPDKWIETQDTPARFRVYLREVTESMEIERLEFWQVPTLFSEVNSG